MDKIKVLICDDSAMVRKILTLELRKDEAVEVIGAVPDPYAARDKIVEQKPDVLLLDIEMPRMDGLTFLRKLMKHYPVRVIIVSSIAQAGSETALTALEYGALEVMCKPDASYSIGDMSYDLISKIKAVARIPEWRLQRIITGREERKTPAPAAAMLRTTNKIIAIGASTGGTDAIREVLVRMPFNCPPIAVVQHMPANFTKSFAERLNSLCQIKVKEAENMEILAPGKALIAPGNFHLALERSGAVYYAKIYDGPPVHHQRPAVDNLFYSVAKTAGKNAIGALLTGMGRDGADGLLEMKKSGAHTVAQDEATSVIFGMPGEAVKLGAAEKVLPITAITDELLRVSNL